MSTYRLDRILSARSLAVIGASPHVNSVGRYIIANIVAGGFAGQLHVVNPHYGDIEGVATAKTLAALPEVPDFAIVAVPPPAVSEAAAPCGLDAVAGRPLLSAQYAYRPGRNAQQTVAEVGALLHRGHPEVEAFRTPICKNR
jgi:acetyltransferase